MTKKPGNPRRKLAILAALLVIVVVAYSVFWFLSSGKVTAEAARLIRQAQAEGVEVDCTDRVIWGYPFRMGILCNSVLYDHAEGDFRFTAGEMRSAAQIYQPRLVVAELASPAGLDLPQVDEVTLDWELMRSSIRLGEDMPERVSIESRQIAGALHGSPLFAAANVEGHMRPNGRDLDVAVTIKGLRLHLLLDEGLPDFDVFIDAAVSEGIAWLEKPESTLRGRSATFRHVHFDLGEKGKAVARGDFAVRADGRIDADLTLQFEDARSLGIILANIFPESTAEIRSTADSVAFFGDNAEIPLRIEDGRVSVGPFALGELMPLP